MSLVHHIAATQIAVVQIADFVKRAIDFLYLVVSLL